MGHCLAALAASAADRRRDKVETKEGDIMKIVFLICNTELNGKRANRSDDLNE